MVQFLVMFSKPDVCIFLVQLPRTALIFYVHLIFAVTAAMPLPHCTYGITPKNLGGCRHTIPASAPLDSVFSCQRMAARAIIVSYFFYTAVGSWDSLLVEAWTHDQNVVSLSPGRSGGRIYFSRVNFLC